MARIRGAVEHTDHGVLESPDGITRISARVVVITARQSAQSVPGVRVALSKHLTGCPDEPAHDVAAGVAGRSTAIEITLAADYGTDLLGIAERVRAEVAHRVRQITGLDPVQITVLIDDVLD